MARLRIALCAVVLWALTGTAAARPALQPFAAELVQSYATLLLRGELAIVEQDASGAATQLSLFAYAAAPPAQVHALVADPTLYPRYVRNLTRSTVEKQPDGALLNHWKLSFPIGSFEGTDEIRSVPGLPGAATTAVEMRTLDRGKEGRSRWEFLAAPGGGTLIVTYGYYDPIDSKLLHTMLGNDPALDAGFNLAGALSLLRALVHRVEQDAAAQPPATPITPPTGKAAELEPLLGRGTVAVVRSNAEGRLVDVSVVTRVPAAATAIVQQVREPELWPKLIPSVRRVKVTARGPSELEYDMAVSAMLTEVVSSFRLSYVPGGADMLSIAGPIKGARIRWDIRPDGNQPAASIAVWRANLHLSETSSLLRAMLRIEPSFEHSANLTMGLLSVRALVAQFR